MPTNSKERRPPTQNCVGRASGCIRCQRSEPSRADTVRRPDTGERGGHVAAGSGGVDGASYRGVRDGRHHGGIHGLEARRVRPDLCEGRAPIRKARKPWPSVPLLVLPVTLGAPCRIDPRSTVRARRIDRSGELRRLVGREIRHHRADRTDGLCRAFGMQPHGRHGEERDHLRQLLG
jgi:hypothetical protein